jgi:hypothetical protein
MPSAAHRAAFEQLALPFIPSLYKRVFRLSRNRAEAEDRVQETFSKTPVRMKTRQEILIFAVIVILGSSAQAQRAPLAASAKSPDVFKNPWSYSLTIDGYVVPNGQSFADPIFTADRAWLHLEGRYNYENLRTGSLWVGYNFSTGQQLILNVTPMIGGVFGKSTGIAPGVEASVTYRRIQLWISSEYVFDTSNRSASFYYSWPQLTYSPKPWLHLGLVGDHTKTYNTEFEVEPGLLVGFSHKKWEFTAYEFNAGWTEPTVVLEMGVSF